MEIWLSILGALLGCFATLIGIWLQGRKDKERIKDIYDRSLKVEPTHANTEKLLDRTDYNTEKVLREFKNADLKRITDYVIKQEALNESGFNYNDVIGNINYLYKTLNNQIILLNKLQEENKALRKENEELKDILNIKDDSEKTLEEIKNSIDNEIDDEIVI